MAIRIRNLDLQSDGGKGHVQVSLGDVSATQERAVFVAPVACRVDFIDLYSGQGVSGTSNSAQLTIQAQLATASASTLQRRGTSATAGTSEDIVANTRYRLIPSANNSLTQGSVVELNFSQAGSAVISAVIVDVIYTPLTHRESR